MTPTFMNSSRLLECFYLESLWAPGFTKSYLSFY